VLNEDDALSQPSAADYHALDAAWADEPVRFVGAATPAQSPVHFYESRPGAGSSGRGANRENKS
jgi:nitrate reductase delta subunit